MTPSSDCPYWFGVRHSVSAYDAPVALFEHGHIGHRIAVSFLPATAPERMPEMPEMAKMAEMPEMAER
jgi:hypothetical protein